MDSALPEQQGLYDRTNEHDACGVGFVAHIKGKKSHSIIDQGLLILKNLDHRGAVGADPLMGDGAGILIQIPDTFFRAEMAALALSFGGSRKPTKPIRTMSRSSATLKERLSGTSFFCATASILRPSVLCLS